MRERERSTQNANIVVFLLKLLNKSHYRSTGTRLKNQTSGKGEADAIYAKMEAEAKGLFEILTKQAEGYDQVVRAAGGDTNSAFQLLILEKLPELVKTQVEAVKGIKIDKVTVWDGNGNNENGNTSTANFVSGMMKSVPPLNDLFNMAGLNLPSYLKGKPEEKEIVKIIEQKNSGRKRILMI